MIRFLYILLIILFFIISCKRNEEKNIGHPPDDKSMMDVNRFLVEKDLELIQSFIKRRNWDMTKTTTGYWYSIVHVGNGREVKKGMIVSLDYTESLLDGRTCNTTKESGPKTFRVGYGEMIRGLDEGIELISEGDSARFIFPPHLAYGLSGDGINIPPRSVVVYEVIVRSVTEDQIEY